MLVGSSALVSKCQDLLTVIEGKSDSGFRSWSFGTRYLYSRSFVIVFWFTYFRDSKAYSSVVFWISASDEWPNFKVV